MDSPDEARRHAREHDLDVPHECGKCGREWDCIVEAAWYGFEREARDHYAEHPMDALCDACLEGAEPL